MGPETLRERKQLRAREQIVTAAFQLFEERGFAAVTVADIADRAEVGRTTFFRHFGDKQEVVFADEHKLHAHVSGAAQAMTAPAAHTVEHALAQLEPIVLELCAIVTRDQLMYRRHEQLVEVTPELRDRQRRKQAELLDALQDILSRRGTEQALSILAAQLAGACYQTGRRLAGMDAHRLSGSVEHAFATLRAISEPNNGSGIRK